MKFRVVVSLAVAAAVGAVITVAGHPGVALADPRFGSLHPSEFSAPATYAFDPQHATISFEIKHLGLSTVTGRFNKCSGKIHEDGADLTKSSVEFAAEIESIDTAVAARDTHLKTADFFDAKKWPTISFKSTNVEKSKEGYVVTGDLTIKDKTKSISIPFRHFGPLTLTIGPPETRIGVQAEPIVLKRSDFGVGNQFKLPDGTEGASDAVTVRISFEAILEK